jgi:predicted methyltransferase
MLRNMTPRSALARLALVLAAGLAAGCGSGFPIQVDPERSADIGRPGTTSSPSEPEIMARPDLQLRPRRDPAGAALSATVDAAATSRDRLPGDADIDQSRKGPEVLKFLGIRPGMAVLDLYSGGGYLTELAALVVGVSGRVVAHNNPPYLDFAGQELAARFTPGRLVQVERLTVPDDGLRLPAKRFNAVLMIDVYPDIYFAGAADPPGSRIDGRRLFAEIYQALRPGGILGIADHATLPGAPVAVAGTPGSIDPARLRRELEAVGFRYEARDDTLLQPDPAAVVPRYPSEQRGREGHLLLRFRKPQD